MRDDYERLLDIGEAIRHIEKYAAKGRAAFTEDELIQTWMVHHLQILGEAATKLTDEMKGRYPSVPWRQMTGMRNVLVHGYFAIDLDIVWLAIEDHLPALKAELARMMEAEKPSS